MVKLKDINRTDEGISCNAYVEGCKIPVKLFLKSADADMVSDDLPDGYEYCTSHLGFVERYIRTLFDASELPEERLIMWY